jgi:hypothetical protein
MGESNSSKVTCFGKIPSKDFIASSKKKVSILEKKEKSGSEKGSLFRFFLNSFASLKKEKNGKNEHTTYGNIGGGSRKEI